MVMKKIKVKDYYAIKRAKARCESLSAQRRKEISQNAINTRWNKYEQTENVQRKINVQ